MKEDFKNTSVKVTGARMTKPVEMVYGEDEEAKVFFEFEG